MTDAPLSPFGDLSKLPPEIDPTVAHPARIYDYALGGTANFDVDRQAAERNAAAYGGGEVARADVRACRALLGRTVRYLVNEAGIRQFLDIGTGLPNADNVHAVAQQEAPECRVVYVDNDPLVVVHAQVLLQSTSEGTTAFIRGDLRDVESILLRAEATLDFHEPMAVILSAILHFVTDEDGAYRSVARLIEAIPSGSYLMISHVARDLSTANVAGMAKEIDKARATMAFQLAPRTRDEVARFVEGLDLVEPGLVTAEQWHPDEAAARTPPLYAVVARKP